MMNIPEKIAQLKAEISQKSSIDTFTVNMAAIAAYEDALAQFKVMPCWQCCQLLADDSKKSIAYKEEKDDCILATAEDRVNGPETGGS